MSCLCVLFSCFGKSSKEIGEDVDLDTPSITVYNEDKIVGLQETFVECLIQERDSFIDFLSKEISLLCDNLDKIYKDFLVIREKTAKTIPEQSTSSGKVSEEEIHLDVLDMVISATLFFSNELQTLLEDKTYLIRKEYDEYARNIRCRVAENLDNLLDLGQDVNDYFTTHFSIMSKLQMKQDLESLRTVVENSVAEYWCSACIKEEEKICDRFIEFKFQNLSKYNARYLAIALLLLEKATNQKDGPCIDSIRRLEDFAKKDADSIKIALEKSRNQVAFYNSYNKDHRLVYLDRFIGKSSFFDMRDIESRAYNYLVNLSSFFDTCYETFPLNDSNVAITFMNEFLVTQLSEIRKDLSPHIRKHNSEVALSKCEGDSSNVDTIWASKNSL